MSDMVKGEPQTDAPLASSNVRVNADALFESDVESLRVRAQVSPNMTVQVEDDNSRAYVQGNTALDFAGGNSPTFTAPVNAGEKRLDLLTLDSSRVLAIVTGTPTTGTPSPPDYPSDKMVLAEIFLRKDMASIKNTDDATNGYIFKARSPVFNLGGGVPAGASMPYGGAAAPTGWLLCDGSAVSQSTYAALFAVIGTTCGNPGGGNFNVPDLRGRFPLGKDNMGSSSANRVPDSQAENSGQGSGASNKLIEHSHSHNHDIDLRADTTIADGIAKGTTGVPTGTDTTDTDATNAGSGSSSMNPYLTLNYIIKK